MATQNILPVGSNVVIASVNSPARWYKTGKEIIVNPEMASGVCPLRRRSFLVQRDGTWTVWFSRNQLTTVNVPAPVAVAPVAPVAAPVTTPAPDAVELDESIVENFRPAILCYDIPAVLSPYSPCGALRSRGFHLQGSVWVVDQNNMPWDVINEMIGMEGVDVQTYKFEGEEARKLVRRAVKTLQADIAAARARAVRSAEEANTQMRVAAETTGASEEEILAAQLKRTKAIQKRLEVLEADLTKACKVFGIKAATLNVQGLGATSRAIHADMRSQARAFQDAQRALRATGTTTGVALAASLADGTLPPVIAADYLDEYAEGAGEALRTAFTPPTEEDTFSLVESDEAE